MKKVDLTLSPGEIDLIIIGLGTLLSQAVIATRCGVLPVSELEKQLEDTKTVFNKFNSLQTHPDNVKLMSETFRIAEEMIKQSHPSLKLVH